MAMLSRFVTTCIVLAAVSNASDEIYAGRARKQIRCRCCCFFQPCQNTKRFDACSVSSSAVIESPGPTFRFGTGEPIPSILRNGVTYLTIPPLTDIGRARIFLLKGEWPSQLRLRTRIPSLEGFGSESPNSDAARTRVGEFLEIEVPKEWYEENPDFIQIYWVDYFRS